MRHGGGATVRSVQKHALQAKKRNTGQDFTDSYYDVSDEEHEYENDVTQQYTEVQDTGAGVAPLLGRSAAPLHLHAQVNAARVVTVQFLHTESSLGLVMDWSMALPVIAEVKRGEAAAARRPFGVLGPGLLLIRVNDCNNLVGYSREKVVSLLEQRPLVLEFESPEPGRFGEALRQPWQCTSPSAAQVAVSALAVATGTLRIGRIRELSRQARAEREASGVQALRAKPLQPLNPSGESFFERHPERIPLSRFGSLESAPKSFVKSGGLSNSKIPRIASDSDLSHPPLFSSAPNLRSSMVARSSLRTPFSALGHRFSNSLGPLNGNMTGASCHQNGCEYSRELLVRKIDSEQRSVDHCYLPIVDAMGSDSTQVFGPGPSIAWTLDHEDHYACRIGEMRLAKRVREAYEVGFRACKRERPSAIHLMRYKAAPPRPKKMVVVEEDPVWCDLCGEDIADLDKPFPFYYCRLCKRNGNRYELCMSCHAIEVLQGQGKHAGQGPHPHFLRCDHSRMVEMKDIRSAYPTSSQVRRIFCDHCGDLLQFQTDDASLFLCPRCPEEHGLRFELCEPCASKLRERGHGLRCLMNSIMR